MVAASTPIFVSGQICSGSTILLVNWLPQESVHHPKFINMGDSPSDIHLPQFPLFRALDEPLLTFT